MNTRRFVRKLFLSLTFIVLVGGTLACSEEVSGPRAWIDFPRDGASVPVGAPVSVVAHAYARDGVAEVLLSVNGEAYRRSSPTKPGDSFSQISQEWLPQQEGDYLLQVKTFSKNGESSNPATVKIKALGKGTVTPVRPITLVVPPVPISVTPVPPSALSDLAIVSVDAVFVSYRGETAVCRPRVVYRNAGTIPVPNDYVIQLHVNGTPQMTMTRGAGFGVGGTSEAIFDYLFEGTPYIGINLDSTNAVAESNETNNAFAEARMCRSGPVHWYTDTPTPTPTRTPTIGIPPPAGCSGTPNIASFSASPSSITVGNSTTLSWGAVTNADSVTIEPGIGGVSTPGSRAVAPGTTTTYTLTARCGSNTQTRQTTVTVLPIVRIISITPTFTPTRTRTPTTPPDTQAPPAPHQASPSGTLSCLSNVTLDWDAVSDLSGIKTYYVKLLKLPGDISKGSWQTTATSVNATGLECGFNYRWGVMAEDNRGNDGNWSWMNFYVQPIH